MKADRYRGYRGPCVAVMQRLGFKVWSEVRIPTTHGTFEGLVLPRSMEVLNSGIIAQGPRVKAFEEGFAAMCGVKHAIATSSGTTALHTAMLAHGIGAGDEVITSAFTFIASSNSVLFTGAKPVFVDIDPRTFNIDPATIEAAITKKTKAILPVHLYGLSCDMDPIMAIAEKHGLAVIEDACQAHGAEYKGRRCGTLGDIAAFSFYGNKIVTTGEGGMVTTDDHDLAERASLFKGQGQAPLFSGYLIPFAIP